MKEKPSVLDQLACVAEVADKDVIVNLYGVDGNALSIVGECRSAMSRAGVSMRARKVFFDLCLAGTYEELMATCAAWCTIVHIAPCSNRGGMAIGAFRKIGLELDG